MCIRDSLRTAHHPARSGAARAGPLLRLHAARQRPLTATLHSSARVVTRRDQPCPAFAQLNGPIRLIVCLRSPEVRTDAPATLRIVMCTTAIRLGGRVLAAVAVTGSQPSTAAGAGRPPPRLRSRQARGAGHGGRPTPAASRPGYCPTPPAPRGPWPRPTWRRVCDPAAVAGSGRRPPATYADAAKARRLAAGYPGTTGLGAADVAEHHLVRLALGGYPRSEQKPVAAAPGTSGAATAATSARRPRDCPEHLLRAIIAA